MGVKYLVGAVSWAALKKQEDLAINCSRLLDNQLFFFVVAMMFLTDFNSCQYCWV